jgi:hypothetical protein
LPTNFGDIAHYHKRIAARYYLLAQIERSCGKNCEADYHAQLAVRYVEAAQEQKIAMTRTPGRFVEIKKRRPWALLPGHGAAASARWLAVQRLAGKLATSIRQSIARRNAPLQSLSLN